MCNACGDRRGKACLGLQVKSTRETQERWRRAGPLWGRRKHPALIYARDTQFNKCSYRQLENSQTGEFAAYAHLCCFLKTICCCFLACLVFFKPHKGYAWFSALHCASPGEGAVGRLPRAVASRVFSPGAASSPQPPWGLMPRWPLPPAQGWGFAELHLGGDRHGQSLINKASSRGVTLLSSAAVR